MGIPRFHGNAWPSVDTLEEAETYSPGLRMLAEYCSRLNTIPQGSTSSGAANVMG